MKKPILFTIVSIGLIFFFFTQINRSFYFGSEHESLIDFIKIHQDYQGTVDVNNYNYENLRLQDVKTILTTVGEKSFQVTTRQDKMIIQNCSACHQEPLTEIEIGKPFITRKSHWEVINPHGQAKNINCTTCHNQEDVSRLNVGSRTVNFDMSFQLCSICHSREFKDWSGGAHGKRVGGWAGEKIINNCTDCHNPHSPGFTARRPTTMNPLPPSFKE